jgi:hypothetical protein
MSLIELQGAENKGEFLPELKELIEQDRRYALFDKKFGVILTLLEGSGPYFEPWILSVRLAQQTPAYHLVPGT